MSTSSDGDGSAASRAAIEADIAATRARLGETVESLGHKLDVKERAKEGVAEAAHQAREQVAERTTEAVHRVKQRPAVPVGALAALAVLGVAVVLWRRRR